MALKQLYVGKHIAPLGHIILIPRQLIFPVLLKVACSAEKQLIPMLLSMIWPDRARSYNIAHLQHANHYTIDAVDRHITHVESKSKIQYNVKKVI
jgi:hypothetical protein